MKRNNPVLVAGATGFVGSHVCRALADAGFEVVASSRSPERAAAKAPQWRWVELDVDRPGTMRGALEGVRSAVYLIHGMDSGPGYEVREANAAIAFREAAATAGLQRIVYLGGVAPKGTPSKHLWSRIRTGELLREGSVPTIELRAGMVIGHGSLSWQIVRDLAARLPIMILPRWLKSRSQPIGIRDVVFAIRTALELEGDHSECLDIPGPEILSGEDILRRIAKLLGIRPLTLPVPVLTPKLSSYWLRLVTRADFQVARELVEGLKTDLLASGEGLWARVPDHALMSFDDAARQALEEAQMAGAPFRARAYESLVKRVALRG